MRYLAIGHLCLDVSHSAAGGVSEYWGGIANAIATLGALAEKNDTIIPVCGVGKAEQESFLSWVAAYPAVDTAGIHVHDAPTNAIHLYRQPSGVSVTCAKDIAPPIGFDRIRKFLNVDAILVNMASGFDITLETLDMIRMETRPRSTPIHFDFHNLSMGVSGNSERFRRPLADWRRWAFMNTTVQVNEEEAVGLAVERLTEVQAIGHLLTLGVHGVVVTRGHMGSSLFTSEHKKVLRHDFGPVGPPGAEDPTGLGDIFGGAFVFAHAKSSDMKASAEAANRYAGEAASRARADRCLPPRRD